jgi:hypothetical protein
MRKQLLGGLQPVPNLIHEQQKRRRAKRFEQDRIRREKIEADNLVAKGPLTSALTTRRQKGGS